VNPRITVATAGRVLRQLRHDHRTIGLLLGVPVLLLVLLRLVYDGQPAVFNRIGTPLLGIFPLITMFLVTSIATLRERTSGTLERLLTMPLAKLDLLLGYALAFGAFAVVQVSIATAVALPLLHLTVAGPAWLILVLAVANAVLGTALGLFVSAFAASEFQAVQFMPAVVLPQLLLCGLLIPRAQMQTVLRWASDVLPLSYAVDAMTRVTSTPGVPTAVLVDLAIVVGCVVAALLLGAATLRRRTA
jgi:ABC-2 type transport system permease protein